MLKSPLFLCKFNYKIGTFLPSLTVLTHTKTGVFDTILPNTPVCALFLTVRDIHNSVISFDYVPSFFLIQCEPFHPFPAKLYKISFPVSTLSVTGQDWKYMVNLVESRNIAAFSPLIFRSLIFLMPNKMNDLKNANAL